LIIFIEGPSGAGKTTLSKKIAAEYHIPLWLCPEEVEEYKMEKKNYGIFVIDEMSILRKINWKKNHLVTDRHPVISEWVYSSFYKRDLYKALEPDLSNVSEFLIGSSEVLIVYLVDEKAPEQRIYDEVMWEHVRLFAYNFLTYEKFTPFSEMHDLHYFIEEVLESG